MASRAITNDTYKLFPSPRNLHHVIFAYEVFVPYPYMMIDMAGYNLKGKFSLFAAYRLADGKNGQLVTLELETDQASFIKKFVPD